MSFLKLLSIMVTWLLLSISCRESPTSSSTNEPVPIFVSLKEGRISTDGGLSRGIGWGDYDQDGDPDLYVANSNGQWNTLYRNNGAGKFKKMTGTHTNPEAITVIYGGNSQGVSWVDYDNDGDLDLYVVSRGEEANLLFRNDSTGVFTRVEKGPLATIPISASMACWADIELDGDLDVVLAGYGGRNSVFRNEGNGQFEQVTDHPLAEGEEGRARACGCADVNNDGLPEFYIANARRPNFYYKNLGDWNFERVTEGHLVEDVGYSYGVSWADYDGDGDLDLFVANFDKENFLYQNDGNGQFTTITEGIMVLEKGGASKGHSWGDYDNDGDLDLYVGNGTYKPDMANSLYLNNGDGTFKQDITGEVAMHADTSAGVAHADYDRDGDLDLFVANWGSSDQINRFYVNQTDGRNNWITFRLSSSISNTYAVGAKVELASGDQIQTRWVYPVTGYGSQDDYEIHFGLGTDQSIDSVVVTWPSGNVESFQRLQPNRHYRLQENKQLAITN